MKKQHLRVLLAILALALASVAVLEAKVKKGEQFFKQGQEAEMKGDWDTALSLYKKAVGEAPSDAGYLIAMRKAAFQSGEKHVGAGQKLREAGKLDEAMEEFKKALAADPASGIAVQEIKRTQDTIERAKKDAKDQTGLTPVEQLRHEEDLRVSSMGGPPELKPVNRHVPEIKMVNQPPRILYETVGKVAGFNVVFDPTYQPPRAGFTADMGASDVDDALDYLAVLTHTFWKPMNANTIFVTDENVTKRRDYEDNVVRTFYVTNATSVQEFQEIANAVRTLTTIRSAFTYNAQKALVLRGTSDEIRLAEKLIRDLDKPKAEVVVDVIIMTANSSYTRDLAATILNASTGNAGLNIPAIFNPRNAISLANGGTSNTGTTGVTGTTGNTGTGTGTTTGTGASTAISLANLGHISTADFATTLPNAMLEATMTDSRTKVLDRPQLRASDGMKATLNIGDRIPYATGSFQPGVGTVGVSPLVSTQFNFIDTGTTIDITPQVHSADEVTLHIELNVSAVASYVNQGGLEQPVISQNKNTADIRLRNGEVNILSGLSSTQDSIGVNGIPGLVNMPLLGSFLFGSNHKEKDSQELLIALIPHIVRTPDYTPDNLRGVYAGVDQVVRVNYAHPEDAAPAANGATPAPVAGGASTTPAGQATPAVPVPAAPKPAPGAAPTPVAATPAPSTVPQAAPSGPARLSLSPSTVQVARNANFTLTVQADGFNGVFSVMPLRIKYDPAQVRLSDVMAGDLLSRDGIRVTTVKDIRNDAGEATLTISRVPGSPGVTGGGALATLNFVAVGMGNGTISITEADLKSPQGQTLPATMGNVSIAVQ